MKSFISKMIDKRRELLQTVLLVGCVIFPEVVNLSGIIRTLFGGRSPDFSTAKYYYLMKSGNWTIGIILAVVVLCKYIRKFNQDKIIYMGNIYHDHSYCWYWFCSRILGYKKCNLILVPIYTQYKLVIRDTFKEYPLPGKDFLEKDFEIEIIKTDSDVKNEVNLILEDTYPIIDSQIPDSQKDLYTIRIKQIRDGNTARVYSPEFVETICKEVRELPDGSTVYVYATTNPKHNYEIAKKVFALANRGNLKGLFIYQQDRYGERNFTQRSKNLYRFFEV